MQTDDEKLRNCVRAEVAMQQLSSIRSGELSDKASQKCNEAIDAIHALIGQLYEDRHGA